MARVLGSIPSWIFQKERSLKNRLLYSISILDILNPMKWSNVFQIIRGGQGLVMSLPNINKDWWMLNTTHKVNLLIFTHACWLPPPHFLSIELPSSMKTFSSTISFPLPVGIVVILQNQIMCCFPHNVWSTHLDCFPSELPEHYMSLSAWSWSFC